MVVEEIIDEKFVRHYSDKHHYIRQVETGNKYIDAVDTRPCQYTYIETDIEDETESEIVTAEEIAEVLGGIL